MEEEDWDDAPGASDGFEENDRGSGKTGGGRARSRAGPKGKRVRKAGRGRSPGVALDGQPGGTPDGQLDGAPPGWGWTWGYHYGSGGGGRSHGYRGHRRERRKSFPGIAAAFLTVIAIVGFIAAALLGVGAAAVNDMSNERVPFGMGDFEDQEATVRGTVIATDASPLEDVLVTLEGEGISDLTDSNGVFILYGIPWGEQTLVLNRSWYLDLEYTVYVMGDMEDGHFASWGDHRDRHDDDREYDEEMTLTLKEWKGEVAPVRIDDESMQWTASQMGFVSGLLVVGAIIVAILSTLVAIAAVCAYRRKRYGFVLMGSVIGMFLFFIIPGLIALVLVFMGRDEFKRSDE
jgi:hypothetical protein